MSIWLGMGSIQYGSQGRPMCIAGNISAQITAKIVIASAARLMAVRQFWRSRNRIAEISVPAWPMPTQNTKLTMSQAQPTGLLLPQIPIPFQTRCETAVKKQATQHSEMVSAMYQARGGLGASTMRITVSVIFANGLSPADSVCQDVWSLGVAGASPAAGSRCHSCKSPTAAISAQLRVGVPDQRQVRGTRPHVQLLQQRVVARVALEPRYLALGVVEVTKDDRLSGAAVLASSGHLTVAQRPVLATGTELTFLDALHAVRALLHDAAEADRDLGVVDHLLDLVLL